jgi:hypothetical protein
MHAAPELFAHPGWRPSDAGAFVGLRTPLGALDVAARVDGHPLRVDAAVGYHAAGAARLWVWDGGVFRAELLRCRPRLLLPSGLTVDGCEAAMWRLRARERPAECEVSCRWVALDERAVGDPARGDGREARSWQQADRRVTLGTAALGHAVHHAPDGFVVSAPLDVGASFETHFVVAWSAGPPADATWLAVDRTPEQVLAGIDAPPG